MPLIGDMSRFDSFHVEAHLAQGFRAEIQLRKNALSVSDEISTSSSIRAKTLESCHKRRKPQAPTPQAPIRNRQTRKVANAKGLNHNTNLT